MLRVNPKESVILKDLSHNFILKQTQIIVCEQQKKTCKLDASS